MTPLFLAALSALATQTPAPPAEAPAEAPVEAPAGPDRSRAPEVLPPEVLSLPEPTVHPLGPGVVAWHVRVPQVRKVVVQVIPDRGLVELLGRPTQEGRATGWMADVAAGPYGAAALSELRDLNEIELSSSIGLHDGKIALSVPKDQLPLGLELQSLVLRQPTWPKKDLARYLRDQQLWYTVEGPTSQAALANSALAFAWFPADHPYGARPDLTELKGVKPKGLDALYDRWLRESPITAVVVGDVAWEEVEAPLKAALTGLGREGTPAAMLEVALPAGRKVVGVDLKGQAQVAVRLRMPAPPRGHEDRVPMIAANWVLGGHFLSRLNKILREEKGYTYGSGSAYNNGDTWGAVTVQVDVKAENLADTLAVIDAELARLCADGVTVEELDMARRSLVADWNNAFQTADSAVQPYLWALEEQRTIGEMRALRTALADLTPERVAAAATTWLGPDQPRVTVLVGDREALSPVVEGLGQPTTWVDPASAILGKF